MINCTDPQANVVRLPARASAVPAPEPTPVVPPRTAFALGAKCRHIRTGQTGTITGVASCGVSGRPLMVVFRTDAGAYVDALAAQVEIVPANVTILCALPGGRTLVRTDNRAAWIIDRPAPGPGAAA